MTESTRNYLSGDARRAQLLELGMRLFGSRGYEEVSIDDIAREAGISKGLMYHYFGGKRALYLEIIRYAGQQLLSVIEPDPRLSRADNMQRGLHKYFEFVEQRGDAYQTLILGGLGTEVQQIVDDSRQAFVDHILVGLAVPLPGPQAWRVAIRSWLGAVEAAALDWLKNRESITTKSLVAMLSAGLVGLLLVAQRESPLTHLEFDLGEITKILFG